MIVRSAARMVGAVAMLTLLPSSPGLIAPADAGKSKSRGSGSLHFSIAHGILQSCSLTASSGDADVDEAVCRLVEKCVEGGATTTEQATACALPHIHRLEELLGAGLLAALNEQDDADQTRLVSVDASRATSPIPQEDDIIVTGRRTPGEGWWLLSENGHRLESGFEPLPFGSTEPPPPETTIVRRRNWRRCIKTMDVEAIMAEMMLKTAGENAKSPCQWAMKVDGVAVTGSQICSANRSLTKGKINGIISESHVRLTKTALHQSTRSLFDNRVIKGNAGHADPLDSASILEGGRNRQSNDEDPFLRSFYQRPKQYTETTTITGFRVGTCKNQFQ